MGDTRDSREGIGNGPDSAAAATTGVHERWSPDRPTTGAVVRADRAVSLSAGGARRLAERRSSADAGWFLALDHQAAGAR
ncbi:MAG: hypothetical protein LC808_23790 [Actinobacteria bacterium]|nr:hypothetical protein [Actinomycetota bacterium]